MTKKKSLLEKLRLVETAEEEFNPSEIMESLQMQSQEIEEQLSETPQTTFQFDEGEDFLTIPEVYEKAEVSDLSKSIFKVEEYGRHLPDDLPSDVKRQSVIGILTASGLQLDDLLLDGKVRIDALREVAEATTQKSLHVIKEKELEITDLLNKIDSLKQDIIDRKAAQEKQDVLIEEEEKKIGETIRFISPK